MINEEPVLEKASAFLLVINCAEYNQLLFETTSFFSSFPTK